MDKGPVRHNNGRRETTRHDIDSKRLQIRAYPCVLTRGRLSSAKLLYYLNAYIYICIERERESEREILVVHIICITSY